MKTEAKIILNVDWIRDSCNVTML